MHLVGFSIPTADVGSYAPRRFLYTIDYRRLFLEPESLMPEFAV